MSTRNRTTYTYAGIGYIEVLPSGSFRATPKLFDDQGRGIKGKGRTFKPVDGEGEREAQRWLTLQYNKLRSEFAAADMASPESQRWTLEDIAEKWAQRVRGPQNTRQNARTQKKALVQYFGPKKLISELDRSNVEDMIHDMEIRRQKGKSGSSRASQMARLWALQSIVDLAQRWNAIQHSPTAGIRIKKLSHGRDYAGNRTYRTPSEAEALAAAEHMPHWLRATVFLGAYQGWRISEVCGLQVTQVDLLHGCIEVGTVDDHGELRGHTKSGAPVWQPMAKPVADALREHIETYAPTKSVFVQPEKDPMRGRPPRPGKRLQPQKLREAWGSARVAAELAEPLPRFHDLRHLCATVLKEQGASLWKIQEFMRHASIETTQQYWGGTSYEDLKEMVDATFG